MNVLLSLLLVAVLSPRTARTQQNPNTDFVNKTIGLLTLNATDEDAKNCFFSFAQTFDNATPQHSILSPTVDTTTRIASVELKACLDNAANGTLKNVAANIFAAYLDIANNLEEFYIIFASECVQNATTISAMGKGTMACLQTDCANYLELLGTTDELLKRDTRIPRQEENQRCKALKCLGLCAIKSQATYCGEQFSPYFLRQYKLQNAAFLYTYLLGLTVREDVSTLPCRCKWFFK